MFDFLRRLRAIRKVTCAGRAEELDLVLGAMLSGGHFSGAKGCLLVELARDGGWIEPFMKKGGNRDLSDAALGKAWAARLKRHIRDTRHQAFDDREGGE